VVSTERGRSYSEYVPAPSSAATRAFFPAIPPSTMLTVDPLPLQPATSKNLFPSSLYSVHPVAGASNVPFWSSASAHHLRTAGVGSAFPAAFLARTSIVWRPFMTWCRSPEAHGR
jgi:hypothetical protein